MKKQYLTGLVTGLGALVPLAVQALPPPMTSHGSTRGPMEPGEMIMPGQLPAGYNYPAAYQLSEGWNVFATVDYIFWMANQENMEFPDVLVNPVPSIGGFNASYAQFRPMKTTFKSGFKVGLGWQMPSIDNWIIGFEYTWYHNTFTDSLTSGVATKVATGLSLPDNTTAADYLTRNVLNNQLLAYSYSNSITIREDWRLEVDILDGKFERPYYLGMRLRVNPEVGVRTMWIEQTIRYIDNDSNSTTQIKYHSNNWGLGPRFAMRANWFLGMGISLASKVGASFLFTQYNEVYRRDNNLVNTGPALRPSGEINVLRPQTEASLGVQWGSYIRDDIAHLDLSATYDFNIFWNQNEAFSFLAGNAIGNSGYPGSLYLHGLTIRAGLDF